MRDIRVFTDNRFVCRIVLLTLLCWSAVLESGVAYEDAEHQDIGTQARNNYIPYVAANPDTAVGDTALQYGAYWNQVFFALTDEDSGVRWRQHFWNVAGGDNDGLWGFDSAYTRATSYWAELLQHYQNGQYEEAYYDLGCVMHLAADMGVPAHVNLDAHPPWDHDWYEHTYIVTNRLASANIDTSSTGLRAIMVAANGISRAFDSGPADGGIRIVGYDDYGNPIYEDTGVDGLTDARTRRAGGFTLTPADEGAAIAAACYPAAIAADGAVLKLFFDTVKPSASLVTPAEGDICSGMKGVQFASLARSYNEPYNVVGRVNHVDYYYSTQDPYVPEYPGSFTWAADCFSPTTAPNGDLHWKATWTCNLDNAKVWVRAVAVDNALCRSLPHYKWIRIDSTRPVVVNTRP